MKVLFRSVVFIFSVSIIILNAQDSTVCFLRDPGGRIREHNADFTHMFLNIKLNVTERTVYGTVKYKFRPIQYVCDTLFLDAPGISIKSALLDGKEVRFTIDSTGVTFRFASSLNWNKNYELQITYEAQPRKGLYFVGWDVDAPNTYKNKYFTRKQVWTQGQGIDNRHWIPCYDDVNDKLITEMQITFDTSYTVIANGVLKEKKKNTDGTATWHYAMSKPMVPYLIMLAIDRFAYKDYKSKNGQVSRQYYYADRPEDVEPTYRYSAEMMDWMCNELQVPYPWETYANVPVQDFMYGAMENTTATIFGDFYLTDKRAVLERPYVSTNAHELTHQWFGDYITEYSAAHHWLHESFATYYAKQFTRTVWGEDRYEWEKRGEANQAIAADRNDRYAIGHSQGGSARVYPKGSFVIDMLRYVVGDSVYRKCITQYLKKHAYGNVHNHDFEIAFMETAGVNLDWFFEQWVYRSGFPEYVVNTQQEEGRVTFFIRQKQRADLLQSYFKMPVVLEAHYTDGTSTSQRVWISREYDTVHLILSPEKTLAFTLFDPASNILKNATYNKSYNELAAQVIQAPHMIDRYDALLLLRDVETEKKRALLLKVFASEKFYGMKNEVLKQLAKDKNDETQKLFAEALQDKDFLVRRAAVEEFEEIGEAQLPLAEKLLSDTSYITIETALRKLCKLFPQNKEKYLSVTNQVLGINNNVRIAWLEMALTNQLASAESKSHINELTLYCSSRFEFRTRVRAFESIERLNLCNDQILLNLFNAACYTNNRLNGPAVRTLKTLVKNEENKQKAQVLLSLSKYGEYEKNILGKLVN